MNIEERLSKYFEKKYYLIITYILFIIGFVLSFIYEISDKLLILPIILIVSFSVIELIMALLLIKNFKISKKIVLSESIICILNIMFIPIFIGLLLNFNTHITNEVYNSILCIVIGSILCVLLIIPIKFKYNENSFSRVFLMIGLEVIVPLIVIIIIISPSLIEGIINLIFLGKSTNYLNISIASIALCATLSMLSFSYYDIIDKEDLNLKNNIKKNGEGFFIATILSMISLVSLYILPLIRPYLHDLSFKLQLPEIINFLLINIVSLLVILIIVSLFCTMYYLVICSISSLKLLKFI